MGKGRVLGGGSKLTPPVLPVPPPERTQKPLKEPIAPPKDEELKPKEPKERTPPPSYSPPSSPPLSGGAEGAESTAKGEPSRISPSLVPLAHVDAEVLQTLQYQSALQAVEAYETDAGNEYDLERAIQEGVDVDQLIPLFGEEAVIAAIVEALEPYKIEKNKYNLYEAIRGGIGADYLKLIFSDEKVEAAKRAAQTTGASTLSGPQADLQRRLDTAFQTAYNQAISGGASGAEAAQSARQVSRDMQMLLESDRYSPGGLARLRGFEAFVASLEGGAPLQEALQEFMEARKALPAALEAMSTVEAIQLEPADIQGTTPEGTPILGSLPVGITWRIVPPDNVNLLDPSGVIRVGDTYYRPRIPPKVVAQQGGGAAYNQVVALLTQPNMGEMLRYIEENPGVYITPQVAQAINTGIERYNSLTGQEQYEVGVEMGLTPDLPVIWDGDEGTYDLLAIYQNEEQASRFKEAIPGIETNPNLPSGAEILESFSAFWSALPDYYKEMAQDQNIAVATQAFFDDRAGLPTNAIPDPAVAQTLRLYGQPMPEGFEKRIPTIESFDVEAIAQDPELEQLFRQVVSNGDDILTNYHDYQNALQELEPYMTEDPETGERAILAQQAIWEGHRDAVELVTGRPFPSHDISVEAVDRWADFFVSREGLIFQNPTEEELQARIAAGFNTMPGEMPRLVAAANRVGIEPPAGSAFNEYWWSELTLEQKQQIVSAYRSDLETVLAFPVELAANVTEWFESVPEPIRKPLLGLVTVGGSGLTGAILGAGLGAIGGSVVPGLGTIAGALVGLGVGMGAASTLIVVSYINPETNQQMVQAIDTATGKIMETSAAFNEWISERSHPVQVPADIARGAFDIITAIGAIIPLMVLSGAGAVRSGQLDRTVGTMAEIGGGIVIFPVVLAAGAAADPWRGIPYAAGTVLTMIIPARSVLTFLREARAEISPRGIRGRDMALEINIARIQSDILMNPTRLRAFTEAIERAMIESARTGRDIIIRDLEGIEIGHVSPLQNRFGGRLTDAVYSVGGKETVPRAVIEQAIRDGQLVVGRTGIRPGQLSHADFMWASQQPGFEFARASANRYVIASRFTLKDLVDPSTLPPRLSRLWDIWDNSARRNAIYEANARGDLPPGVYPLFKGYQNPLKFEFEMVISKNTPLKPTPTTWYSRYIRDVPTGTTYVLDPMTGKPMPVYWLATEAALRAGKGVPALSRLYAAKAYSIFIQSLRNLLRIKPRRIEFEVGEGRAAAPWTSKFSAIEVRTIQDTARKFVKREINIDPGEARAILEQERSGAVLMLELREEAPPFVRRLNLADIESMPRDLALPTEKWLHTQEGQGYGSLVEWQCGLGKRPGDLDWAIRNPLKAAQEWAAKVAEPLGYRVRIVEIPSGRIGETGSMVPGGVDIYITPARGGGEILLGNFRDLAEHLRERRYGLGTAKPLEISGLQMERLGTQAVNRTEALMRSGLIEDAPFIRKFKNIGRLEETVRFLIEQIRKRGEIERAARLEIELNNFLKDYATRRYNERVADKVVDRSKDDIAEWQREIEELAQKRAKERGEETPNSEDLARASEEVLEQRLQEQGISRAMLDELFTRDDIGAAEEPFVINIGRLIDYLAAEEERAAEEGRAELERLREAAPGEARAEARTEAKEEAAAGREGFQLVEGEPYRLVGEEGYGLYGEKGYEPPYIPPKEKPYKYKPYEPPKEEPRPYRPPPYRPPPYKPPPYRPPPPKEGVKSPRPAGMRGKQEEKRQEFAGAITWKQGFGWWSVKAPYKNRSDVAFFYKDPPPNAKIVKGGAKSALRSIQTVTGIPPKKLTIDLGIMDIIIRKPGSKPGKPGAIEFKRDPEQKATGDISIVKGSEEVPLSKNKMPKKVAFETGSYDAKVTPAGEVKVKARRL